VLISLLGLSVTALATGALWYLLTQQGARSHREVSIPAPVQSVSPPSPEEKPAAPSASTGVQTASPPAPSPTPSHLPEPEMVAVPAGTFQMGSSEDPTERPVHQVSVRAFSIGKYPVTVREWNACSAQAICRFVATGEDQEPVRNVSWTDAKEYAAWIAKTTGKRYRLPTEAEWEYAARGGTRTRYWWGDRPAAGVASCKDCGDTRTERPPKVGAHLPNPLGLYDMGGTVDQWVEDCWHRTYQEAPSDGSPWVGENCTAHVIRSGSWKNDVRYVRPANRDSYDTDVRYPTHGLRLALGS
jgi:formylglycine-generating enzyme required for sulfatase activity